MLTKNSFLFSCDPAVALALVEQIVLPPDVIPTASHDQPVDAVIVGDGRLIVAKDS